MKSLIMLGLIAVISISCVAQSATYGGLDVNLLQTNRRLLIPYVKCVLDKGKCSSNGKKLKDYIAQVFQDNCAKCTEEHKSGTLFFLSYLFKNEPGFWKDVKAYYDPEDKYSANVEKELNERE